MKVKVQGFIIYDSFDQKTYAEFDRDMRQWLAEGKIHFKEQVVEGLENAPEYFNWLFRGKNFGKLIVQVAEDPA